MFCFFLKTFTFRTVIHLKSMCEVGVKIHFLSITLFSDFTLDDSCQFLHF